MEILQDLGKSEVKPEEKAPWPPSFKEAVDQAVSEKLQHLFTCKLATSTELHGWKVGLNWFWLPYSYGVRLSFMNRNLFHGDMVLFTGLGSKNGIYEVDFTENKVFLRRRELGIESVKVPGDSHSVFEIYHRFGNVWRLVSRIK